jgi:hypothetical protein
MDNDLRLAAVAFVAVLSVVAALRLTVWETVFLR